MHSNRSTMSKSLQGARIEPTIMCSTLFDWLRYRWLIHWFYAQQCYTTWYYVFYVLTDFRFCLLIGFISFYFSFFFSFFFLFFNLYSNDQHNVHNVHWNRHIIVCGSIEALLYILLCLRQSTNISTAIVIWSQKARSLHERTISSKKLCWQKAMK